ncbi:hypothetical protein A6A06_21680 [Streptomyces sp. CB02923]|uniref:hypothetical protein n=1 Tax=Streptomyces sp. CB02923 TaxID=1718985 RepID=UPI00093FB18B|nr:hypothetical protein [Streptomyces sp. CB02923]OKH99701.1 hypothetical protein A6A06_21680 [Streptomyces sp. CB02923]
MEDEGVAARFDGGSVVEVVLTGVGAMRADRVVSIGVELGYVLGADEPYGRGQRRLLFTRDDSPGARQRAQATLERVRAARSWSAVTAPYGPSATGPPLIHPERAARAQRQAEAYEAWRPAWLVSLCCCVAAGFLVLAWAVRETVPAAVGFFLVGLLCLAGAALGPRFTRSRQQDNLRLLERFRRQQAARFPVPPPSPPPPRPPPAGPQHDRTGS